MIKQDAILSVIAGRPLSRSSIVLSISIQSVISLPMSTAYTVTEYRGIGSVQTASKDYAKDGLRINAICPDETETLLTTAS
jgi:NAD(P)-dependent dehydrogenase (short-subunit alcohol dehydrogenase family)